MHSRCKKFRSQARTQFLHSLYLEKKNERRLRYAASTNNCDRLKELLDMRVNPNACDENGRTALHLASASGYSQIVETLLAYNADCNVVDKLGNTPLHLAVCTTSASTINLLLNAGCSLFQKGHNGCTPIQLAHTKLLLLQKYCNPEYSEIKLKITKIIETMTKMVNNEKQNKNLTDLVTSVLLLRENSDLPTDVDYLLKTLNDLKI